MVVRGEAGEQELAAALASKRIVRVFPGVFCVADKRNDLWTRARVLGKQDPSAVITERAAARLTWWKDLNVGVIVAARADAHRPVRGYTWTQRRIPEAHVVRHDGYATTDAALTVLDLIPSLGGKVIDEALRRNAVTLEQLRKALDATPGRPGNSLRRRLLEDSRDEPWSESERGFHAIVRGLSLPWAHETNRRVTAGTTVAYLDVALTELRLGFEVDGYPYHHLKDAFYHDRARDLDLAAADWEVHRIPSDMIGAEPTALGRVVRVIAELRAEKLAARKAGADRASPGR